MSEDATPATDTVSATGIATFYDGVIEYADLLAAARVEGVDTELALLREKFREVCGRKPEDYELMLRCVDRLVKVIALRYRISKERANDMASAMAAALNSVGDQLGLFDER